jgi:hypothetical protein
MLIAKEKRKTNIAEFILYIWQIEDLIRAYNFDFELIKKNITSEYKTDAATLAEIEEWYKSLILMMQNESIVKTGHLQIVIKSINELNELHLKLLGSEKEPEYNLLYFAAKPNIELFRTKSGNTAGNEIEVCLQALYSLLLMKLAKKEISADTLESMRSFSQLLALLSVKFNEWDKGRNAI